MAERTLAEMIAPQVSESDATMVEVFGEKSQADDNVKERVNSFASMLAGTGGKNIFGQEVAPLSQVELLEMIMPFGGSIRGGKVAKPILSQLLGLSKKLGVKQDITSLAPRKYIPTPQKGFGDISDIVDRTELGIARIQKQKALDKYGISDSDKQEFVDSISALLSKWSKN